MFYEHIFIEFKESPTPVKSIDNYNQRIGSNVMCLGLIQIWQPWRMK